MEFEQYHSALESEKRKLTEELNSFAVEKGQTGDWDAIRNEVPGNPGSPDEVADQLEEMNERKAAEVALENRLARVNLALKKIGDGNFGYCEIDNKPIEEDRLTANPAARTCKEHLDQEEHLPL